jgi:IS30 family transposase
LTAEDREDISRFLVLNMNNKEIAARLDRDDSVICREISRNGGRAAYRAIAAQRRSEEQRLRPKTGSWTLITGCANGFIPIFAAATRRIR